MRRRSAWHANAKGEEFAGPGSPVWPGPSYSFSRPPHSWPRTGRQAFQAIAPLKPRLSRSVPEDTQCQSGIASVRKMRKFQPFGYHEVAVGSLCGSTSRKNERSCSRAWLQFTARQTCRPGAARQLVAGICIVGANRRLQRRACRRTTHIGKPARNAWPAARHAPTTRARRGGPACLT